METMYTCQMHPEVRGQKGDKCPKCGMNLVPLHKDGDDESLMKFTSLPITIEAEKPTLLTFVPQNEDGKTIELEVVHKKGFHVINVNDDLSWFHHIHPIPKSDGACEVTETFPTGGKYFLFADYKPQHAAGKVEKILVEVKGSTVSPVKWTTSKFISETNDYVVKLANGDKLKPGKNEHLKITIEKENIQLTQVDLQDYLGALAHIIMIGVDDKTFIQPVGGIKI